MDSSDQNTAVGHTADQIISSQDTSFLTERVVHGTSSTNTGNSWSVDEIVSRIWPYKRGTLARADGTDDKHSLINIENFCWPGPMLMTDTFDVWTLLQRFPLFSFDTTFILSVNSTITHGGYMVIGFDYHNSHKLNSIVSPHHKGANVVCNCDHVWLDLSKDSDVELFVPFQSITPYLTGRVRTDFAPRFLGQLLLYRSDTVYIPLSNTQPIDWTISVQFSNLQTFGYGAAIGNRIRTMWPEGIAMPKDMFNSARPSSYIIGDREGETDLWTSRYFKRSCFFRSFLWGSTDAIFKQLLTASIHPFYPWVERGAQTTSWNLSTLSYLSLLFGAWQGDFKIRVKIASNQMMSGRIVVIHNPYGTVIAPSKYQNYPHQIIDIKETHEFDFELPFMLACTRAPIHHKDHTHGIKAGSNGNFELYVLHPLRSGEMSTFSVVGYCMIEPLNNMNFSISSLPPAHAEAILGRMLPPPRTPHFLSVQTLMHSFFEMGRYTSTGIIGGSTVFAFPVTPLIPVHKGITSVHTNRLHPVCHIARMFSMWSGSLRFKVVSESTANRSESSLKISHLVNVEISTYGFASRIPHNTQVQEIPLPADVNNLYEFDVPFRSFYERLHVTQSKRRFPSQAKYNGHIVLRWPTGFVGSITLYCAAGADLDFTAFVGGLDFPSIPYSPLDLAAGPSEASPAVPLPDDTAAS